MRPLLKKILPFGLLAGVGLTLAAIYYLSFTLSKRRFAELYALPPGNENHLSLKTHHSNISLRLHPLNKATHRECLVGENLYIGVQVINNTDFYVPSTTSPDFYPPPVNVGYFLRPENSSTVVAQAEPHFTFPYMIIPNTSKDAQATDFTNFMFVGITCPRAPGNYSLQLELVQERVAWQHDVSPPSQWVHLSISTLDQDHVATNERLTPQRIAENILQNSVTELMFEDKVYAAVFPGSIYPMLWVRDMAAIQSAFPYVKALQQLKSRSYWGDIFLIRQRSTGEIDDWQEFNLKTQDFVAGKNTVQSDQELWLVWSYLEGIRLGILSKESMQIMVSQNKTRLDGLVAAMEWLFAERWHKPLNCLWNGHTADWGDVGLKGPDGPTSTRFEAEQTKTCGIFQQSLLYQVLSAFEKNFPGKLLGARSIAKLGGAEKIQASIIAFVNQNLWQDEKGFFKIHTHIESHLTHNFAEEEIFPLGGNVLSMEANLATPKQQAKILEVILARQQKYDVSTVGAVLLPSYPPGTFENPIMDEMYEYQNGGQWDWFGLRVIPFLAKKNRTLAFEKLRAIQEKILTNKDFFEWDTLKGEGRGSPHFRTSAAIYLKVMHELEPR